MGFSTTDSNGCVVLWGPREREPLGRELTVRLSKGLRVRSWVGWAVVLFALLALGMAVPVDVLGLDDSGADGQSADAPVIAELVQVKAIRLSEEALLPGLSTRPLPSSVCPAVLEARRTSPNPTARLSPLLCSRNLPRAHIGREASRAIASTSDPVRRPGRLSLMGHTGSGLLRPFVDEVPVGLSPFQPSGLSY